MTEKNYLYLGEPINSDISPINYHSNLGEQLSVKARKDIDEIESFVRTSVYRARDFIMD